MPNAIGAPDNPNRGTSHHDAAAQLAATMQNSGNCASNARTLVIAYPSTLAV